MNPRAWWYLSLAITFAIIALFAVRESRSRETAWRDQVENHGCQVFTYVTDGVATRGDLCRLPDGTVLRRP